MLFRGIGVEGDVETGQAGGWIPGAYAHLVGVLDGLALFPQRRRVVAMSCEGGYLAVGTAVRGEKADPHRVVLSHLGQAAPVEGNGHELPSFRSVYTYLVAYQPYLVSKVEIQRDGLLGCLFHRENWGPSVDGHDVPKGSDKAKEEHADPNQEEGQAPQPPWRELKRAQREQDADPGEGGESK